jgi:putative sugar O-methyltransferase
MSLTTLRAAYARAADYAEHAPVAEGDVSEFWTDILVERPNYPSFDDMLLMRRGFTYPMAERRSVADRDADQAYARAAHAVARASIADAAFLEGLDEPAFGCPQSFDFGGKQLTANCLVNAITVHRVIEAVRSKGPPNRPLRVLEIGAGFGQAARQLLERLDIGTYAVCDLPENLFLSAFYLQGLFPERQPAFVDENEDGAGARLAFVVPRLLRHLSGPFDLVLNSYSFQEMNRASVNEYFAFGAANLAPNGLMYSLNAHGKDEIAWPSEYPVDSFRLVRLHSPRRFPFFLMATVPYELVLAPGASESKVGTGLDGICSAMQLGLDADLEGLCDRFTTNTLEPTEAAWLDELSGLFRAPNAAEKADHASRLAASGLHGSATSYLTGALGYATGAHDVARGDLADALGGLASPMARLHAEGMLATLAANDEVRDAHYKRAIAIAPHLQNDLKRAVRSYGAYAGHVAAQLRLAGRPSARTVAAGLRERVSRLRQGQ